MPAALFALPILSTLIGGALALRFRKYLPMLVAVGAGILLGAAFLDLLPEALSIGRAASMSAPQILALTLLSFLVFFGLEAALDSLEHRLGQQRRSGRMVRKLGASMLIFHSFRDGMAIGAAFTASHPAGYAVALGIAAHDVGDGMNTVLLTGGREQPDRTTYLFLLADAVAPFAGGLLTSWWTLSLHGSVILLVLAAGFFLQMATGDFLPELLQCKSSRVPLVAGVLAGAMVIFVANQLIGRLP